MKKDQEHYSGCLLGGAVGDALGAPVEFLTYPEILALHGPGGYRPETKEKTFWITDDTQMSLFTAEGLLRAVSRAGGKGAPKEPAIVAEVYGAYLRWLVTQGERIPPGQPRDGWLLTLASLHARRAPGNTCLTALKEGRMGTVETPLNNSKGCGGVMRAAPVGLFPSAGVKTFDLACQTAAITHGHPSGYLPAGVLAEMIRRIIEGSTLPDALEGAIRILCNWPGHEETLAAIRLAQKLLGYPGSHAQNIEAIGGGWVGEEALAISLYCSFTASADYRQAILMAINHSGDSDSTGAITGNILGAYLGKEAIPLSWLANLELASETEELAHDLLTGWQEGQGWQEKYPAN